MDTLLFILKCFGVFLAMVFVDIVWVFYIRKTTQGKAVQAASLSTLIVLLGAFVIINYVENLWYIVPTILGAFVGTYVAVKIAEKRDSKIKK